MFGDRDTGAYLLRFGWTKIVRHRLVPGGASPDDPTLATYWTRRRRGTTPPLDRVSQRLLHAQHWRCPACGGLLLAADQEPSTPEWEQWTLAIREAVRKNAVTADTAPGRPDDSAALRLLHAWCRTPDPRPHASASL